MMRNLAFLMVFAVSALTQALAADRTGDLAVFREEIFEKDKSYSVHARAEAEALLQTLEGEADRLSDATFELRLAEIVARADNGHTIFFTSLWREKFNRAPIKTLVLEEKLYIGAAGPEYAGLVWAEVTHIGGAPWAEIRSALARYQGGVQQWKDEFLRFFVESPEIMHAVGFAAASDRLALEGVLADGKPFAAEIVGVAMAPEYREGNARYVPPSRLVELSRELRDAPLYLRDGEALFRFAWLEGDVAYIQFKANTGEWAGFNTVSFSDDVIRRLSERMPRHVIVDQRFNSGGDLNYSRHLMQALPSLTDAAGKVYVITSGKTFSAAISSVGYLEQAGGERVVIVGEPVGDRLEFWAEGPIEKLPQSGAEVLYATERHNYMTGCPEDDCHKSIVDHPIAVPTLEPDIAAPMSLAAFRERRDPAMEKIMERIKSGE